jgi:type IV pilus assembly protein PilY1
MPGGSSAERSCRGKAHNMRREKVPEQHDRARKGTTGENAMVRTTLFRRTAALLVGCALGASALAAKTDLADAPLTTSSNSSVLPNLMFILDNSGSMAWEHMPDDASDNNNLTFKFGFYGLRSSQCNGIYYDSSITYKPPVDSAGISYANANFYAAVPNGFKSPTSGGNNDPVDLSTSFRASYDDTSDIAYASSDRNNGAIGRRGDGTGQAAYYYSYTGTQTTSAQKDYKSTTNTFYQECSSLKDVEPGKSVFTKVVITDSTQQQNFANWYSFYRTRILMMKTATGLAFKSINDKYRVGLMTINNNNSGASFVNVGTFNSAQKRLWYSALYDARTGSGTPLRESLSVAGRIFAGKVSSLYGGWNSAAVAVTDPMQYSCQQNFAILSTDGFWNGNDGFKLDGSTSVGNQDGGEKTPYWDGASTSYQKSTSQVQQSQTQTTKTTNQIQMHVEQLQREASYLQKRTGGNLLMRTFSGGKWSSWKNANSCTWDANTECDYDWGRNKWNNASSCTKSDAVPSGTWSDNGTDCQYTPYSWEDASSCAVVAPSPGPANFTVGVAVRACQTVQQGAQWQPVQDCSASTSNGKTVTCRTVSTGPTPVASCTPQSAKSSNNWTQTLCDTQTISAPTPVESCTAVAGTAGNDYVATSCNTVTTGPTMVASCTPVAASAANNWTATVCAGPSSTSGTSDTLADVAEYYYKTDLRTDTCTGSPVPPAATGNDVCENNVPGSGEDNASWQHMTTFTLGLGARGRMVFSPTYQSDTGGDFFAVKNKATATADVCTWQTAGTECHWPTPGSDRMENIDDLWHAAVNGRGSYFSATNPVTLASGLINALAGVTVRTGGTAAATTSSPNIVAGDNYVFSSNYTSGEWSGELFRFTLDPTTLTFSSANDWEAQKLLDEKAYTDRAIYTYDPAGTNRLKRFNWDNLTNAEKAYFSAGYVSGATAPLQPLSQWCNADIGCLPVWQASHAYLVGDEYRNGDTWYRVTTAYTSGSAFGSTDTANTAQVTGPAGQNLVNFLRGDRSNEGPSATSRYFRARAHVLGDIISSEAVYIKAPHYRYLDAGYADYKAAQKDRKGMVYVAANDGMLHAFVSGGETIVDGDNAGQELWAYIPSMVLPNLYKLADKSYAGNHRYFVDGTPAQGDVFWKDDASPDGAWHTILVGGLNGGGRGYYALDVTDPDHPKALWEFTYDTGKGDGYTTDANLGFSFGRPVITKLKNGTWVVLVTSGYNNGGYTLPDGGAAPGDGKGYLYVLNAATGAIIGNPIGTGVGSANAAVTGCDAAPCPSGLGQIAQWADDPALDNTAKRVYGGDMFGNLWRFDIDNNLGPSGNEAQLLATLRGPSPANNVQPITAKPVLGRVDGLAVAFVATGRMLGVSDLNDSGVQSVYAVKDTLGSTSVGNPRDDVASDANLTGFVQQVFSSGICPDGSIICSAGQKVRLASTPKAVNFGTQKGWFVDLPESGERVNTDPQLALGTLAFNSNIPNANACTAGGYSYAYFLNYRTGAPVSTGTKSVVGVKLGNGLTSRPVVVRSATGKLITINQVDGSGAVGGGDSGRTTYRPTRQLAPTAPSPLPTMRVSWRELIE